MKGRWMDDEDGLSTMIGLVLEGTMGMPIAPVVVILTIL